MDVFSVSISNSLTYKDITKRKILIVAIVFATFHGIMPIVGYFLWSLFMSLISSIDHWVAFALLAYVGWEMIVDFIKTRKNKSINQAENILDSKTIFIQWLAVSIDAIAVWLSFSTLDDINIRFASWVIAVFCILFSLWWFLIWKKIWLIFKDYAQLIWWLILIWIGIKILLEHLLVW